MNKNAALNKVSGFVSCWYFLKECIQIHFDATSDPINTDFYFYFFVIKYMVK